ncbi:hypothetical protein GYMLUDRAFT_89161 [Collybiopsis luxurians FD-317 M1]|uniref:MYND-type domain-containing protein n=1 Tax=Collybiopsis luxurians FD-317 M1 TaxID=944289 RepID=A0A0D0C8B1_9AGAR|nr:hypothetical protein GYMLUDRAFT_89161 [Collybiopsis luxurians FD-317 M1]
MLTPVTARVGLACCVCFTGGTADKGLLRCAKCRSVSYCGPECQKKNWASHKSVCKVLHKIDNDPAAKAFLLSNLSKAPVPSANFELLNRVVLSLYGKLHSFVKSSYKQEMMFGELNMVLDQPKCLACTRTDRFIRLERDDRAAGLKSCPDCHLAFYCAREHWDIVSRKHTSEPVKHGYDDLSQCALNQNILADIQFASIRASDPSPGGVFHRAPKKVKAEWEPLPDEPAWKAEFGEAVREMQLSAGKNGPPVDVLFRASTEELSYPMSILYALQNLNPDDEWTKKDTLSIHLLGASVAKEATFVEVFEEILHRLPQVKTLKLLLCNPDLKHMPQAYKEDQLDGDVCRDCKSRGREWIFEFAPETYHEHVRKQKSKVGKGFTKPDLAIAFNSGISFVHLTESWKATVNVLVNEQILTAFTAFSKMEAEADILVIRQTGANMLPLGPRKNPWSSQVLDPICGSLVGYRSSNMWFAAGFRG